MVLRCDPAICHALLVCVHVCSYLLPPIIFYCGLSVEKHRFFLNLPSILLFGIVGTLMSFVITGEG